MELKEKVEKQVAAGFTIEEISSNLASDGYSKEEVDRELAEVTVQIQSERKASSKGMWVGLLLIFVVIMRIARNAEHGSTIGVISVLAGIVVVVVYFANRR
jgi:hypothetical protein